EEGLLHHVIDVAVVADETHHHAGDERRMLLIERVDVERRRRRGGDRLHLHMGLRTRPEASLLEREGDEETRRGWPGRMFAHAVVERQPAQRRHECDTRPQRTDASAGFELQPAGGQDDGVPSGAYAVQATVQERRGAQVAVAYPVP